MIDKSTSMSCELCGSTKNLMNHHVSYEPEVVQILCSSCHQKQHPNHGVGLAHLLLKPIPENFPRLWRTKTRDEITKILGISYVTVYNWAKKLGLHNTHAREKGKGKVWKASGHRRTHVIYIPTDLVMDSTYPFKPRQVVDVEIRDGKIIISKEE